MIWFTSDSHFHHNNVIRYCNRPFSSIKEMNEQLIDNWNKVVKKNDIVYHAGDFALCSQEKMIEIIKRLNGKIKLCIGSHDKIKPSFFVYSDITVARDFEINYNGQMIFISHYCHKVWPKSHYGSWHLFGHSHGGMNKYTENEGKLLDIGVDCHNFTPISYEQVKEIMETRPLNFNDLKKEKWLS